MNPYKSPKQTNTIPAALNRKIIFNAIGLLAFIVCSLYLVKLVPDVWLLYADKFDAASLRSFNRILEAIP